MTRRTGASFGPILEKRGDYENARRAFDSAGMKDDARRVECKITALALARRFEEASLPHRAARILLDNGLEREAMELAERIPEDKPIERFAKGLIFAKTGQTDRLASLLTPLKNHGPYGVYLFGKVLAEVNIDGVRFAADSLSGKPVRHEGAKESPGEDAGGEKLFIKADTPSQIADGMLSIIMWSHSTESEKLYYALRLYQRAGDEREARRCLEKMDEPAQKDERTMTYYLAGLFALEGREAVLEMEDELIPEKHHSEKVLLTIYYAREGVDCFRNVFEFWHKDEPVAIYTAYADAIYGESSFPLAESFSDEEVQHLIGEMAKAKETVILGECAKLADYRAALAEISDYQGVQRASEILRSINLNLLEGGRKEGIRARSGEYVRLADIASGLEDKEAQLFAGDIYSRNKAADNALACARKLLALGEESDAAGLIQRLSKSMGDEERIALAKELEDSHPLISLEIYRSAKSKTGFVRLARTILAQDDLDAVENVAWRVSSAWKLCRDAKRSLLMQDALQRLEEFGEAGTRIANAVRVEMRVGHLFVETELDSVA